MPVLQNIRNVTKQLFRHPAQSFAQGVRTIVNPKFGGVDVSKSTRTVFNVGTSLVPGASVASAGVKTGGRILQTIKKLGGYVGIGQPQSVKQVLKNTATFGVAYVAGNYLATGKLPNPSLRTVAGYAGAQLNLPATIAGAIHGAGSDILATVREKVKPPVDINANPYANFNLNEIKDILRSQQMPSNQQVFNLPSPAPVNIQLPSQSFSPSISAGGGGSDLLPLLLLGIGGAGLGGYLLGKKKKRKKKKYKKRRVR